MVIIHLYKQFQKNDTKMVKLFFDYTNKNSITLNINGEKNE